MKDKHPESTSQCIYCITGQQHPRLARGETYTCGYKPYRCEVCNYSTTTKGNLSIHMQSDKHINNMQELQNGGVVTASDGTKITQNILSKMPLTTQRLNASQPIHQQPNFWRCDICNFETNLPRNLRIHMTSEKHIQNITAIQQNMKQIQGLQMLQNLTNTNAADRAPAVSAAVQEPGMMMDMQHNQSMFLQMLAANRQMQGPMMEQMMMTMMMNNNPGSGDLAPEPPTDINDPNPTKLFNCCICREFNTDLLDSLSSHIAVDRSMENETEVAMMIGNTHICKLCSYKTNLKANFQLHCKTDKHLQKLQLVNHIMEGGPTNEWKLNFMNVSNSVQLRCNACDFYTDSIHKLQIHSANQGHEVSGAIFNHLRKTETELSKSENLNYNCSLCKHETSGKGLLLQHCRSVKHLQMEQLHILQLRSEGSTSTPEIGDIFTVTTADNSDNNDNNSGETKNGESTSSSFLPRWQKQ